MVEISMGPYPIPTSICTELLYLVFLPSTPAM